MIKKTVLFSLMISTCLTTAFGMENFSSTSQPGEEKGIGRPRLAPPSAQARTITSAQELINYVKELSEAANTGKYAEALKLAYPEPKILYSPRTLDDSERYFFTRAEAIHTVYHELAKCTLDSSLLLSYHEKDLRELYNYLKDFATISSQHTYVNQRMTWHRYLIYRWLGGTYFEQASLKNNPRNTPEQTAEIAGDFQIAIKFFEKALEFGKQSLSLPVTELSADALDTIKSQLPSDQFSLFSAYCSFVQCIELNQVPPILKIARNLCHDFKTQRQNTYHSQASTTLQALEEALDTKRRLLSVPIASRRIEEKRAQTAAKTQQEILTQISTLKHPMGKSDNPFKDKIQLMQKSLEAVRNGREDRWAERVVQDLLSLENEIRTLLTAEDPSAAQQISLETVYDNLRLVLGGEVLIDTFWNYIVSFILTDKLEEGIQRAEILKAIEMNQHQTVSYKSRFLSAALKNLKGDHAEWLELEKELTEKANEKKLKDKARKAKASQRKVEAMKVQIAEQIRQASQEKSSETKEKAPPSSAPAAAPPKPRESETPFIGTLDTLDEKQRKLERLQRHEEAETARNQEKEEKEATPQESSAPSIAPTPPVERPLSKEEQRELILQSSPLTIAELYGLSSRPLEVDQEIENNTWQFTRSEFETYLKAMGCESKSGKGVHTKADLPKATLVTCGDEIITILNDFGGAIPLPLWDKDYVPHYLRRQILEARKNLRALKIAEINAKSSVAAGKNASEKGPDTH